MLKDTFLKRCFVRTSILSLRAIAPLSTVYCCVRLTGWRLRLPSPVILALDIFASCEVAFFALVYLPRRWLLNRPAPNYNPLPIRAQREALFEKTWDATHDPRDYVSRWFYGAPLDALRREDMKDFLSWRMWNKTERSPQDDEELNEYLARTEKVLNWSFPPGKSKVPSMMVTFEPLKTMHRPLVWYMIITAVETQFWFLMIFRGFKHYRPSMRSIFSNFPFRLLSMLSNKRSASSKLPYWYRKHTSDKHLPVLFIHGIGVGLHTYLRFLRHHLQTMPEVGIIAIEILPISSRISPAFLHGTAMSSEILKILQAHGWDKFILATHSYGSVIGSYLMHDPLSSSMIDHMLLVDPVAFSFHTPDVAYNFLRRKPRTASEIQLQYFASTDLDVTYTLTRRFAWPENSLWRDEVEDRTSEDGRRRLKTTVALSGEDIITDTLHLAQYLTRHENDGRKWYDEEEVMDDAWMRQSWTGEMPLEVLWFPDLNHAEAFDDDEHCQTLVDVLQVYAQGIDE